MAAGVAEFNLLYKVQITGVIGRTGCGNTKITETFVRVRESSVGYIFNLFVKDYAVNHVAIRCVKSYLFTVSSVEFETKV